MTGLPIMRHARLREGLGDREHMLVLYGRREELICWCGPYTAEEAYRHALVWGAAGWAWPSGRLPAVLQAPKVKPGRPRRLTPRVKQPKGRNLPLVRTAKPKRATTRAGLRAQVDAERVPSA